MDTGDSLHQFADVEDVVHEEVVYGIESDFDYHEGVIGACEQVCVEEQESVQTPADSNSPSYILPEYTEDNNYLNIQGTEEVITSDNWYSSEVDDVSKIPEVDLTQSNLLEYDDTDEVPVEQSDSPINNNPFPCDVCGRRFRAKVNLMNHVISHQNDRPHACNLCGARYLNKFDLSNHLKTHACSPPHLNEDLNNNPGFFFTETKTSYPQKKTNTRSTRYQCSDCRRVFRDKVSVDKHLCADKNSLSKSKNTSSSNDSEFNCTICGKNFKSKTRLKRHMLSHRDKITCNECGDKFTNERDLLNHSNLHKKKLGDKVFKCNECDKVFSSRSSQQIHVRVHTGEKPYACRFCVSAFADGGTLRKHERIHTGEKPYVCVICTRAFNQRVVLREHVKSHHIGPDPKYEGTATPYCCQVCNVLFSTSEDIYNDIVDHCDENTARGRQPQMRPRKYKRRSKLKSHGSSAVDIDSDDENFNTMEIKTDFNVIKKKRGRKSKQELLEIEECKRRTEIFFKQENYEEDEKNFKPQAGESERQQRIFSGGEINRPRTKNVSRPVNDNFKFVPATFPSHKQSFDEISAAVESIKMKIDSIDNSSSKGSSGGNIYERRGRRRVKQELHDE
ncbi:zinc finger protein 354C-like [Microplitis mediator]|uniref:zinc finger protein 354C-like n=1 Tax=Microplitis mediator TaxID=375433 RepID=UPI002554AE05|nr:zinc finger protein 354C-like [Microplitis mediator]